MTTRLTSGYDIINGKVVHVVRKRLSVSERLRQKNSKRIKPVSPAAKVIACPPLKEDTSHGNR